MLAFLGGITLATESKKFKAPHFRELDSHNEGCVWLNAHKHSTNVSHENDGGTEYENHQRTLRQKLTDLVNTFDPNPKDKTGAEGNKKQQVDDEIEGEFVDGYTGNIKNQTSVKTGEIRTNHLERLVETYREAKSILPIDEFNELEIKIVRHGRVKLSEYFKHIRKTRLGTNNCVIYGGGYLVGRNGNGFNFKFYDKIENIPIYLSIESEKMDNYRFRKYIESYLEKSKFVQYYTLYAIGTLIRSQNTNTINLVVDDLRHLAFFLGPERTVIPKTSANDATK